MDKVKQADMINKHIDRHSSKRAEKLKWNYKLYFADKTYSVPQNNN